MAEKWALAQVLAVRLVERKLILFVGMGLVAARALAAAVDPGLLADAEQEAERDLAPYRSRMPPNVLAATRARATAAGLRRRLRIPRLAVLLPDR